MFIDYPFLLNHVQQQLQTYKSSQGKKIFVLDELFPSWILQRLRRFTLDYGKFAHNDFITENCGL